MAKRYKIYDNKYIPGLGNGPFEDVLLPDTKAVQLKQLGIKIKEVSNMIPIFREVVHTLQTTESVEVPAPVVEEVIEEIPVVEETIEEIPEVIEEEVLEIISEEETEVELTEESLTELTNSQLKQILIDNKIEIPARDTKANLVAEILNNLK